MAGLGAAPRDPHAPHSVPPVQSMQEPGQSLPGWKGPGRMMELLLLGLCRTPRDPTVCLRSLPEKTFPELGRAVTILPSWSGGAGLGDWGVTVLSQVLSQPLGGHSPVPGPAPAPGGAAWAGRLGGHSPAPGPAPGPVPAPGGAGLGSVLGWGVTVLSQVLSHPLGRCPPCTLQGWTFTPGPVLGFNTATM